MTDKLRDAPIPEESWADGAPVRDYDGNGEYIPTQAEVNSNENYLGHHITIRKLLEFVPEFDETSVLGDRFLCKGGSCVIVAQTHAGKSSLGMQMAIMFALGLPFFGIHPARPLKSVYVQAENDDGDTAEMFQGVLAGLGLVPQDKEGAAALVKRLEENLIVVRDQVCTGGGFAAFAQRIAEHYKPDLFWVDPLLSFYGDDISDQKMMSRFLRSQLNPISDKYGHIWMLLHHTAKPSKDAGKAQKSWSSRDFAYMGIGSSELSNWARAIICLTATSEDEFRFIIAKRGWRAGLMDGSTPCIEIALAHSSEHICWKQIPKPVEIDEMGDQLMAFAQTIVTPMSASRIIREAAAVLKRGSRTCWSMWDSGEGPLGSLFIEIEQGKWKFRGRLDVVEYKDD